MAFQWLAAGWRDLVTEPAPSLALRRRRVPRLGRRSSAACSRSAGTTSCSRRFAGFMVVGPIARRSASTRRAGAIAAGAAASACAGMIFVRAAIGRADPVHRRAALPADAAVDARRRHHLCAVLRPAAVSRAWTTSLPMLFTTPTGWALLIVGTRRSARCSRPSPSPSASSRARCCSTSDVDALTAMGTSMALVWNNLPVMLAWGAIVLALFLLSLATGLLGLIVVFPLLGHGTWHAYRAIRLSADAAADELLLAEPRRVAPASAAADRPVRARRSIAAAASQRIERALGGAAGRRAGAGQSLDQARRRSTGAARRRRRSSRRWTTPATTPISTMPAPRRRTRDLGELVRALAVAGFAASNIMMLSVAVWSGADAGDARRVPLALGRDRACRRWSIRGRVFFRSAWQALRHGRTNMDVPISIGVLLAFGISLYETIHHGAARLFRRRDLAAVLPADRPHARPRDARAGAHGRQGPGPARRRAARSVRAAGRIAALSAGRRDPAGHDHPAGRRRSRAGRCARRRGAIRPRLLAGRRARACRSRSRAGAAAAGRHAQPDRRR